MLPYVTVSCRNWRLSCCILCLHRCVWSAVSLNLGGAHMCFVDAWIANESMKRVWALSLMEVQQYSALNAAMWLKYAIKKSSISTQDCHIWWMNNVTLGKFCVLAEQPYWQWYDFLSRHRWLFQVSKRVFLKTWKVLYIYASFWTVALSVSGYTHYIKMVRTWNTCKRK